MKPSLTLIVCGLFISYMGYTMYMIYGMFYPNPCPPESKCIKPYIARKPSLEIRVYTSLKETVMTEKNLKLVWKYDNFTLDEPEEKMFNVSVPMKTRKNGTLFAHVFLFPRGGDPFGGRHTYLASSSLTTYAYLQSTMFSLLSGNGDGTTANNSQDSSKQEKMVTHWRQKLIVNVVNEPLSLDYRSVPHDIHRYLRLSPEGDYLPIVFIDQLSNRIKDLLPVNESSAQMPLTIVYKPIGIGKLRMWTNMLESIKMLHSLGFTEKDTDEIKGIFADTNFYLLALTFGIAALHMLFDFLAFKNEISYWRARDSMEGLSTRVVVWRCLSTIIIFFYLMDQETSLLVLIPAGIGTIIETWKVTKAFKIKIRWSGYKPTFEFGAKTLKEKETERIDSQAMKYLSYVLYPLCIGGAIYSLFYVQHKSWVSWCIQSLVNGVYAFGFLFMLPQLFVNYKLKSVAHLPWRAFMYKAFNTFIDDIFAFIITMPTAHRLACFRDDVVFVIYLYQRWLYPVDKTRVNEYGQSFDESKDTKEESKKTK